MSSTSLKVCSESKEDPHRFDSPLFKYVSGRIDKLEENFNSKLEKIEGKIDLVLNSQNSIQLELKVRPDAEAFKDHKRFSAEGDEKLGRSLTEVSTKLAEMDSRYLAEIIQLKSKTQDDDQFEHTVTNIIAKQKEKGERWFTSRVGLITTSIALLGILSAGFRWWENTKAQSILMQQEQPAKQQEPLK